MIWITFATIHGELAHLVERLHGMQEVVGSIPILSTKRQKPLSERLLFVSIKASCQTQV
jgi:hypothetical protein